MIRKSGRTRIELVILLQVCEQVCDVLLTRGFALLTISFDGFIFCCLSWSNFIELDYEFLHMGKGIVQAREADKSAPTAPSSLKWRSG